MKELEFHPLAEAYPLMEGKAFDDFCTDIRINGLDKPITKFEGKILDGRNRYRACLAVNVKPKFREYTGDDPLGFVETQNDFRRHDSPESQQKRREQRIARVAEKRREGKSQRRIAEEEGVSQTQIAEDLKSATEQGCSVEPEDGKVGGKDGRKRPAKSKNHGENRGPTVTPMTVGTGSAVQGDTVVEREPGSDDPETPELFDQVGQAVPDQAYDAFNQLPEIQKLSRACDLLKEEVERVSKLPVGRCMLVGSILSQIKAVKQNISGSKPAYVCPYCRGQKKDCKGCGGSGWVTAVTWKQAPDELKEIHRNEKGNAS